MNEFRLATYPANSAVANGVTLLVSAWFLVAGAAILSDPTSVYTTRNVAKAPTPLALADASQPTALAVAPDRLSIVVAAKRSAHL